MLEHQVHIRTQSQSPFLATKAPGVAHTRSQTSGIFEAEWKSATDSGSVFFFFFFFSHVGFFFTIAKEENSVKNKH